MRCYLHRTGAVLLLPLVFASCTATAQQPDTRSETNTAFVAGLYNAFASGDVEAVLGALSETVVWNEAENFPYADGNPYVGRDAVLNGVFARIGNDWEYWRLDIQDYVSSGDDVVAFGRYNARHKATGAEVDAQFVHRWRIEGGQAVSFQQYADTEQVVAAMPAS
jgi:uncharacterized protein